MVEFNYSGMELVENMEELNLLVKKNSLRGFWMVGFPHRKF